MNLAGHLLVNVMGCPPTFFTGNGLGWLGTGLAQLALWRFYWPLASLL